MNYWQVAAGSAGRDYSESFLRYGLAFVGDPTHEATISQVQPGDRIILKRGMGQIVAVGEVVNKNGVCYGNGDKQWLRDFDGWDLPAYCHVRWHVPRTPVAVKGLTRTTIEKVRLAPVRAAADNVLMTEPAFDGGQDEPPATATVEDDRVVEFLVREGLRPSSAEDLLIAFRRIRLLANYYYTDCRWNDIREHETRTFLVMPLLLALGWAEQQIKIELPTSKGGKIDIACFSRPYRRDNAGEANHSDCKLIIETKGFTSGLDYAPDQARAYAECFPDTQALVVTNGYCYKTYLRDDAASPQSLTPTSTSSAHKTLIPSTPLTFGALLRFCGR